MAAPMKLPNPAPVIQGAIMKAFREYAPIAKQKVLASLGTALGTRTGRLMSSIYARVRQRKGGGSLSVGTAVVYGRFWEYGFFRGGKSVRGLIRGAGRSHRRRSRRERIGLIEAGAKFYRAKWFRPAVEEVPAEVTRRVEAELNAALKQYAGTVAIDIKIM